MIESFTTLMKSVAPSAATEVVLIAIASAFAGSIYATAKGTHRPFIQFVPTREARDAWYSGAFLLETVPSVLYILMRHGHDPEEALVRAVNDTKDNDTVAAIVGAALGALYGQDAWPARWVENLAGRTGADDDGAAFRLLDAACGRWAVA